MTGGSRTGRVFTTDDVRFLQSEPGAAALAGAAELLFSEQTLITDLGRLRKTVGERSAVVAETVLLRRRAVPKFGPSAAGWLLTETALQQGTPLSVARHRAERLVRANVGVHDLTCSIGADLTVLAGASSAPVVGSDLDPVRVSMAAHNCRVSGVPSRVFMANALQRSSSGLLGYADPARRTAAGRRITSESTLPPIAALDAAHRCRPPLLRVPPGLDFDALDRAGEVELVSLDGVVREAVLWPAELATVRRRASVLRSGSAAETVTTDDADDCAVLPGGAHRTFLIDPDPAVVRAGLVRHYAARHHLAQLDPHLAYLTGDARPPHTRVFRVSDVAQFKESVVRQWLRRDAVGTLEIKQRGTAVVPDELRRRLRPAMSKDTARAATLVIARVGRTPIAYWCSAE